MSYKDSYMKQIRLENFKCYTNQSIHFRSGINLLIGDNASGKTSVLKACKYVLSSFFAGFSDENTRWVTPHVDDFSIRMSSDGTILPEKPVKIHFICNPDQYDILPDHFWNFSPVPEGKEYTLQKNSKKNSRALVSEIRDYRNYTKLLSIYYIHEKENSLNRFAALPLFACFSTEDIHANRKIDARKFAQYAQKASMGYYECLEGNGFFPYWVKRLLVLQEGQKNLDEITIVRNAIVKALGPEGCNIIYDMQIRPIQKKVYYILSDGREVEADLLSDGYKRLVNIVTDIAFRCALLNRGFYGNDAASRTRGTALIDEVDLHLHPTLQAKVLQGLRNAFPNIQLIVTTHAPMVMSGVENDDENIVYKLSYSKEAGYKVEQAETYGMDVSTITNVVLNQPPRDAKVEAELKRLFDLIDEEQTEKARELLIQMQSRFRDSLPELAQAEAMLNFSMVDGDEEDQ